MPRRPLALPLAALFVLILFGSTPALAEVVVERGLTHHQVLQRDDAGVASVPIAGRTAHQGEGVLEARLLAAGQVKEILPWTAVGRAGTGAIEGEVKGLRTGGPYDLELRVLDGSGTAVDTGVVRDLLVGDLWILGGQSNMEGCGILSRGAEPPSRYVHVLDLAHRWLVAEEPLHWKWEAVDPIHCGPPGPELDKRRADTRKHRWRGAGLGLPFAREMVRRTGVPVGLLACAKGATSMAQWDPALKGRGGDSLYGSMLHRIRVAGGKVAGVLWYQGEADALENGADTFEKNFTGFVKALREDVGKPDLPFYYVQLGRYLFLNAERDWTRVRDLQLTCEKRIPPPVGMVAAVDQPLVDAIHLRTRGHVVLGRRLARLACRDLFGGNPAETGPRPVKAWGLGGYPQRIVIEFSGAAEGLACPERVAGFSVRDSEGEDLRMVFDQFLDPDHPNRVILETQVTWRYADFPEDAFIYYGYGNDPHCNLTDNAGQGAPCFGPFPFERPEK